MITDFTFKLLAVCSICLTIVGCNSTSLIDNVDAGFYLYEESQKIEDEVVAVGAGMKWLFGILQDISDAKLDSDDKDYQYIINQYLKVYDILRTKYLLDEDTIAEIANITDKNLKDDKIDSIRSQVYSQMSAE
ncbi:hypothetical protein [Paenibacillus sp. 1781tsa1]|uniref:hypothetical protein n=1 Tax=Paenibacillus sp. 1781tsa1 TaxID=2953810 RepID=UPI00209C8D00|nr:hypothetical protein [Paenibacillus sp. 1781tsa1]MCP1184986.1 hypothetical protein [Paenibacillus sp. 1781tsa1]